MISPPNALYVFCCSCAESRHRNVQSPRTNRENVVCFTCCYEVRPCTSLIVTCFSCVSELTDTWHISQWNGCLDTLKPTLDLLPMRCFILQVGLEDVFSLTLHLDWAPFHPPSSICLCLEPDSSKRAEGSNYWTYSTITIYLTVKCNYQ